MCRRRLLFFFFNQFFSFCFALLSAKWNIEDVTDYGSACDWDESGGNALSGI